MRNRRLLPCHRRARGTSAGCLCGDRSKREASRGHGPSGRRRVFRWERSSSVGFQVAVNGTGGGGDDFGKLKPVGLGDIRGISLEGTADEFCRTLEIQLDRPVVNETSLKGEFSFRVKASRGAPSDFPERLRDQLHLSVTEAQRRLAVVVLKPR